MKYIGQFTEGCRVADVYLCKRRTIAVSKNGKEYATVVLQDKSGTIDAKIWDLASPGVTDFDNLDYVYVEGDVTVFQGNNQLNIRRIRRAESNEYEQGDYLPVSTKDLKAMYQEIKAMVLSISDPYLKKLCTSYYVDDKVFLKKFCYHSAAKSVHHGFVGGLMEHTLGVMKLCEFYAKAYPLINRDLLITAALFHDIGKVNELSDFPENDYTDDGQLLGHIVIGTMMIRDRIREIEGFPKKLATELEHCILAHHGELEYGSPKKPALLEALALNLADNTDAKMETMTEALNNGGTGMNKDGWLGFNRFLDSNIRRTTGNEGPVQAAASKDDFGAHIGRGPERGNGGREHFSNTLDLSGFKFEN
ncbi:3'-5' exoribonuclease [[Clostridium] aminophilum]|uniref:3'-5' exoribonuclease n=1 Tax=[Clostridium] aminophilum TaxID=1526 RepID=A0A1I0G3V2_9FIRM|nr:HD domain-containing protein [[Clostridium] aminophilum]SET65508.1 3'-5' exoribonuclease [[Clostridium] aminophilum]